MPKLSRLWSVYGRFQNKLLLGADRIDNQVEGALNWLLAHLAHPDPHDDAERAARSAGRKERHRARLRRIYLPAVESTSAGPEAPAYARLRLTAARAVVSADDWALLVAIGEGYTYPELATRLGVSVGSLRVRVMRLRALIRARTPVG